MKQYGIAKSVVFPMKQSDSSSLVDESMRNAESHDKRFFFFLRFNPKATTIKELSAISGRFSGFKLHPRIEGFDPLSSRFTELFGYLEELGKPVLVHSRKEGTPYSDPDRLVRLAGMYKGINFVFGHFANDSEAFFRRASRYDNVFVETSIVSSPKIIENRVAQIGADRILFGSDFPYSDQEIELLKIQKSELQNRDKRKILSENATRLLKYGRS